MNKKSIITVILATILAFLATFFLFVFNKKTITEKPELKNEIPVQEKAIETSIKEDVVQDKEVKNIKKESKEEDLIIKVIETPTIKPLKIVPQADNSEDEIKKTDDAGIIKDEVSNEIVITREFKMQSPAKYSFVGYGEQKAPTK